MINLSYLHNSPYRPALCVAIRNENIPTLRDLLTRYGRALSTEAQTMVLQTAYSNIAKADVINTCLGVALQRCVFSTRAWEQAFTHVFNARPSSYLLSLFMLHTHARTVQQAMHPEIFAPLYEQSLREKRSDGSAELLLTHMIPEHLIPDLTPYTSSSAELAAYSSALAEGLAQAMIALINEVAPDAQAQQQVQAIRQQSLLRPIPATCDDMTHQLQQTIELLTPLQTPEKLSELHTLMAQVNTLREARQGHTPYTGPSLFQLLGKAQDMTQHASRIVAESKKPPRRSLKELHPTPIPLKGMVWRTYRADFALHLADCADDPRDDQSAHRPTSGTGAAWEIHNYDIHPSRILSRLIDVLQPQSVVPHTELINVMSQVLTRMNLSSETCLLYIRTFNKGYAGAEHSILRPLRYVISYMVQLENPAAVTAWVTGWLGEASQAYEHGDPTSCVKGVRERVFSGLRDVIHLSQKARHDLGDLLWTAEQIKYYLDVRLSIICSDPLLLLKPNTQINNAADARQAWFFGIQEALNKEANDAELGEKAESAAQGVWQKLKARVEAFAQYIDWDDVYQRYQAGASGAAAAASP